MQKTLSWHAASPPRPKPLRWAARFAARVLRRAGHLLDRWARARSEPDTVPGDTPMLEFHAEAGAPEGALYVNGRFVGRLPGIQRL